MLPRFILKRSSCSCISVEAFLAMLAAAAAYPEDVFLLRSEAGENGGLHRPGVSELWSGISFFRWNNM